MRRKPTNRRNHPNVRDPACARRRCQGHRRVANSLLARALSAAVAQAVSGRDIDGVADTRCR